jgi:DNA-binding NtrC family response regulator
VKAADLDLLELLDLNPEHGSIQFKNRRMLLWDADAFGNLRRELIESLGVEPARKILRRFGFANGYRDAITTGELFSWDNDEEWWLSCPALQNHEGKVNARPQHLVVDRAAGLFEMEVIWNDSYEAAQHRRVFGAADEPTCWSITGYASGFATALMGEECYIVEQQCAALGHDHCRVVGKTRRAWGAAGDRHAADYEAESLAEELELREGELRRQRRALERKERELAKLRGTEVKTRGGIVCKSRPMENVLDLAQTVAKVDTTVLITGESGVGKELLARFVHDESPRADGPFLAVNCGALPEPLLESELFGHVRGSFTGADSDKKGLFEAARGGTIFLDEIGETSQATQVKLLRVLQEKEVRPVGSTDARAINVRVIAATNRNLEAMVGRGEFRKDLYYRLKVVSIEIPPLRDRRDDILPLARELIEGICQTHGMERHTLAPDAVDAITAHHWPGNVRELENAMEHAVVLAGDRSKIVRDDLPPETRNGVSSSGIVFGEVMKMEALERTYILQVLERFDGNRTHTARALGIGANTLWRKLKAWGVPPARSTS